MRTQQRLRRPGAGAALLCLGMVAALGPARAEGGLPGGLPTLRQAAQALPLAEAQPPPAADRPTAVRATAGSAGGAVFSPFAGLADAPLRPAPARDTTQAGAAADPSLAAAALAVLASVVALAWLLRR